MMIESISISSVHATLGTRPLCVAAVAWVWLGAVLASVDFSKSSGPSAHGVTVSRRVTCISAEDSIIHLLLIHIVFRPIPSH